MNYSNYRVMRHNMPGIPGRFEYNVHLVHYDENYNVKDWDYDITALSFYSLDHLKAAVDLVNEAMQKPVLDYETGKEIL